MSHSHIFRNIPKLLSESGLIIGVQAAIRRERLTKWVSYHNDTQNTSLKRLRIINPVQGKKITDFLWARRN